MAAEHTMFMFDDLKVTSRDDRVTDRMKSTKCGPSPHSRNGLVASIVNFQTLMTSDAMKKVCRNH